MATLSTEQTVRQAVAKLEALAGPSEERMMQPRLSDASQATIDAGTPADTAPASPSPSVRQPAAAAPPPGPMGFAASGFGQPCIPMKGTNFQANPQAAAFAISGCEDPLIMSSKSYFRPYTRTPGPSATPGASAAGGTVLGPVGEAAAAGWPGGSSCSAACGQQAAAAKASHGQQREPAGWMPFPKARGTTLKTKLDAAAAEVGTLRHSVIEAMAKPQMHLVEMQQLLKSSEGIQDRTQLSDDELEKIGWPSDALRSMRAVLVSLEKWQQNEKAAQDQLEGSNKTVRSLLSALDNLFAAWCKLSIAAKGNVKVDLSLERRGWGASAMVSALIDAAVAQLKEQPDVPMVRQLEVQLKKGAAQPELQELGIQDLLASTLTELAQCLQGLPPMGFAAGDRQAPEVLWHSIVKGEISAVMSVMQHGGLTSGRVCDPQGHSVLWDAVAFSQADVALLLLQYFPPEEPNVGVNLGETHERTGNNLLHMAANHKPFTQSAKKLFTQLFENMPEALHVQCNGRGQNFLHMAAGNMNFWMLRFALQRGLSDLFAKADGAGWTPRRILANELVTKRIAERLPLSNIGSKAPAVAARMPSWLNLGNFQPGKPGSVPVAFADCAIEVKEPKKGPARILAHRAVLAGCSAVLRRELAALRPPKGEADTAAQRRPREVSTVLQVDPKCCSSVEMVHNAVKFMYQADLSWCSACEGRDLLQLLRFLHRYGFPGALVMEVRNSLLQRLEEESNHHLIPTIFKEVEHMGLDGAAQLYLGRNLICHDRAWDAMPQADASSLLITALTKLEVFFATNSSDGLVPLAAASEGGSERSRDAAPGGKQLDDMFKQQQLQQRMQDEKLQQEMMQQQWQQQWMQQATQQHRYARAWG